MTLMYILGVVRRAAISPIYDRLLHAHTKLYLEAT